MKEDSLLVVLTLAGSSLWWWPLTIWPNLDLPWWFPLAFILLLTGLATTLSGGRWLRFVVASAAGTLAGLCSGYTIWPPTYDEIPVLYLAVAATLATIVVSAVASLAARKVSVSNEKRRVVWTALLCCIVLGPILLALTPPLVAHRLSRNQRIAAERFESLKNAVERTRIDSGDPARICEGQVLKQHYSGPPFSEEDWRRITGNYVDQEGYAFGIYCREKDGYTIHAFPIRGKADGTLRFCTDESRKIGCDMEFNRSRYACIACSK
jgi:hypothetical protein